MYVISKRMESQSKCTAHSNLSKKRYKEFEESLREILCDDDVEQVLSRLCKIMNFDPNQNSYNVVKKRLEKKKEDGVSSYVALNQRKYYSKKKK